MKKKILFIGTGGTIASEISDEGIHPNIDAEMLLSYAPKIREICDVDCVSLYNLDSSNLTPWHWVGIAKEIEENFDAYSGFVISHGTDTMAYTAAALSYMIQKSPKPIILTGAQKPIGFDITDSKTNLSDSFTCASDDDMHGLMIVFNGNVISGLRARKTRSKTFDAFESINYPLLARVVDGRIQKYIMQDYAEKPIFKTTLGEGVALMKLYPGLKTEDIEYYIKNYRALIVESFGTGGLPEYCDSEHIFKLLDAQEKFLVMTTQVQHEGSDLSRYKTGKSLKMHSRVLEAYDMTTEAAFAKIMWILAQTEDFSEIKRIFYTPCGVDLLSSLA